MRAKDIPKAKSVPVQESPAHGILSALNKEILDKLKCFFKAVPAITKHDRPFKDITWQCDLLKSLEFASFIAKATRQQQFTIFDDSKFLAVLSDGSTDSSFKEQEILYLRTSVMGKVETNIVLSMDRKLVALGAAVMMGAKSGVSARLKERAPWLISAHCHAHRLELAFKDTMKKFPVQKLETMLLNIYYLYRNSPLNRFRTLVEEYDTQYQDVTLHAEVRWLSRGIVLEKFVDLLPVIRDFIAQRKHADLYYVSDEKFALEAAFLADTTKHLDSLNLKLQGNNKLLPALVNNVSAFMEKLSLYQDQLGDNDFTHFPNLHSQVSQLRRTVMPMIEMVENPVNADMRDVSQHCESFGVSKEIFDKELIELRNNHALKQKHMDESMATFWMQYVPTTYSTVTLCAKKILTCFGSTYVCESGFSTMGVIKSRQQAPL
uniref:HAT C-terminal dimerisation domain-containing protein n=1 Tax=Salarias fasciatus TaxID=181472 RepID=A0A672GES2_SALFA